MEQSEKSIVISFEPQYVEGKWYYIGSLQKAFRCTENIVNYMQGLMDNVAYEIMPTQLSMHTNVTEATRNQIEATLSNVADAKGFKIGCKVKSILDKMEYKIKIENKIFNGRFFNFYAAIFDNETNEWAEIIQPKPKLTSEQIEAVEKWILNNPVHVRAGFMSAFRNEFQEEL